MIYVYNLASSMMDQEYGFSEGASPAWAVCYAYASENNLMSLLFSARERGEDLENVFPLVYGKHSVACGDYAAIIK